ncbi:MAG: hypothetical protein WBP12_05365 [Candidatus Saccharimonas sp.]
MRDNWVNSLKVDAVTIGTVKSGDRIISWTPNETESVKRHIIIDGESYVSNEDDVVIDVIHPDGHTSTELTSHLGLTPDRYSGKWVAIAIYDDTTEPD